MWCIPIIECNEGIRKNIWIYWRKYIYIYILCYTAEKFRKQYTQKGGNDLKTNSMTDQYACRWVPGLQVINPEFLLVSVLILGCLGPPGDIWQWLKTLLIFTAWRGRRCFWHLEGRDQGYCWASCNTQDSFHTKKRIIPLPIVLGNPGWGDAVSLSVTSQCLVGTWATWNGGSVSGLYFLKTAHIQQPSRLIETDTFITSY